MSSTKSGPWPALELMLDLLAENNLKIPFGCFPKELVAIEPYLVLRWHFSIFVVWYESGPDMQYPNSRGNKALAYKRPTTPFEDGTVSKSIFPPKLPKSHF